MHPANFPATLGLHPLRPSRLNFVSRLLGRTKDDPKHNLDVRALQQYVMDFRQAEREAMNFLVEIWTLPKPHEPLGERPTEPTGESPPSQSKPPPEDDTPSDP